MKPDTEECILYESICMKFYQMPTNLQWQKAEDHCLPGLGEVQNGSQGAQVTLGVAKNCAS